MRKKLYGQLVFALTFRTTLGLVGYDKREVSRGPNAPIRLWLCVEGYGYVSLLRKVGDTLSQRRVNSFLPLLVLPLRPP